MLFGGRGGAVSVIALAVALFCAPGALASTSTADSVNWAGYAVHGKGVTYRTVRGSWRQPSVTCTRGTSTYSSYWVGIGGYSETSQALDQIGTEIDCNGSGQVRSTAWYELVPAGAVELQLVVHPGDLMNATVTVNGRSVSVSLHDVTRKQAFTKTLTASQIDVTSAEWIVEAPSECIGQACQTLLLANFGSAAFTGATATSSTRHTGGINDPAWQTTKIRLLPDGHRFFAGNNGTSLLGVATPSGIGTDDHSFTVSYADVSAPTESQVQARVSSAPRAANLRRPGP